MFGSSKIFLATSCFQDIEILEYIQKILKRNNVPTQNVMNGVKRDTVSVGDYIIRCSAGTIKVFVIKQIMPSGYYETKLTMCL